MSPRDDASPGSPGIGNRVTASRSVEPRPDRRRRRSRGASLSERDRNATSFSYYGGASEEERERFVDSRRASAQPPGEPLSHLETAPQQPSPLYHSQRQEDVRDPFTESMQSSLAAYPYSPYQATLHYEGPGGTTSRPMSFNPLTGALFPFQQQPNRDDDSRSRNLPGPIGHGRPNRNQNLPNPIGHGRPGRNDSGPGQNGPSRPAEASGALPPVGYHSSHGRRSSSSVPSPRPQRQGPLEPIPEGFPPESPRGRERDRGHHSDSRRGPADCGRR